MQTRDGKIPQDRVQEPEEWFGKASVPTVAQPLGLAGAWVTEFGPQNRI